jgi:hypothetical protein
MNTADPLSRASPTMDRPGGFARTSSPLLLILIGVLAACDSRDPGPLEPGDPGEPQAVLLVLTVEDAPLADALQWPGGVIPDAEIRIFAPGGEEGGDVLVAEGTTDEAGLFLAEELAAGEYRLMVERVLTPEERDRPGTDGALALIHAGPLVVEDATEPYHLAIPAARPRSLVFSELKMNPDRARTGGASEYHLGTYFELYNNADTTIYLDGKVVGQGFTPLRAFTNRPCDALEHLRVDPDGIWARHFDQFPGSGNEHPLPPGETVLVALWAIDHGTEAELGEDLRSADFETSNAGVGNPDVPNLIDIGLAPTPNGRGMWRSVGVVWLADALDPAGLTRTPDPVGEHEWARIPAERILDVVTHTWDSGPEFPLCPEVTHPRFDRSWAPELFLSDSGIALHRRALLTLPDGRIVLQHTGSSYADFTVAPTNPGAGPVPD